MEEEIIRFALATGKLKRTVRTGWKFRGVKDPESVAEHSFRTAMLAMLLSGNDRLIRMALLHDIEEAVTGDIMTFEKNKINKDTLLKKQESALKQIFSGLPAKDVKEYLKLWKESEELNTDDANFLKQIDKLEMMLQAFEYEQEDNTNRGKLQSFWDDQDKTITDPRIRKIYLKLKEMRK